jgi:beta-glucosidase-like glycosyl hydrolase
MTLCAAHATGLDDWADAYQQASAIVGQMTIEEKVSVVSGQTSTTNGCAGQIPGVPRLGFPGICVNDGPNGLHGIEAVNSYASAITIGATWNKELAFQRGQSMGLESRVKGGEQMDAGRILRASLTDTSSQQFAWTDSGPPWSRSHGWKKLGMHSMPWIAFFAD